MLPGPPHPLILPLTEEADAPAHLPAKSCWQVLDNVRTCQEGVEGEGGAVDRSGDQACQVYDVVITRNRSRIILTGVFIPITSLLLYNRVLVRPSRVPVGDLHLEIGTTGFTVFWLFMALV